MIYKKFKCSFCTTNRVNVLDGIMITFVIIKKFYSILSLWIDYSKSADIYLNSLWIVSKRIIYANNYWALFIYYLKLNYCFLTSFVLQIFKINLYSHYYCDYL